MKNRFGIASCFFEESCPELWEMASQAGFTDGEIDTDKWLSTEEMLDAFQKIYDDLKAGGIKATSFHLPFGHQWDVSSKDQDLRKNVIPQLGKMLQWSGEHDIHIAVLHASYEPIQEEERQERLRLAADSITKLSKIGDEYGVKIAVEDLPRTCLGNCADELLTLTSNGKSAGVCFDVNHLLKETHQEFMKKVGKLVITTHLSDYDKADEKHWLPGDGCIDWTELHQLFEDVNYSGRYLFELGNKASPSLNRSFTPQELMDRFQKLFFGKQ